MNSDALRSVRNHYSLGFYSQCMTDSKQLSDSNKSSNSSLAALADVYYYLAMTQVKPEEAVKAIAANAPTALLAVKQYAIYKTATEDQQRELVIDTLKDWLATDYMRKDATLQWISAQIYYEEKNYKDSLKLVSVDNAESLEKLSLCVLIYLSLHRLDLASKTVKQMSDLDDDDTLTQLATAWVSISQGGEKVTEASFVLQELSEKFPLSISVLNALAICEIHQKNYTSAFAYLKQARELALKEGMKVSAETLMNSVVCLQQLRKSGEIIGKVVTEFKTNYPNHWWFTKQTEAEQLFARHAANYKFKQ